MTEEDPLGAVLQQIRDGEDVSPEGLEALGNLEGEPLERFRAVWNQLDADRRLDLVDDLCSAVEENLSLNAASVCLIAIEDEDAGVRERGFTLAAEDGSDELYEPVLAAAGADPDREARMAAIEALGTFTLMAQADDWPRARWEPAHETLLAEIGRSRSTDPVMWGAALLSLAYLTTPEAEREIRRAYAEPALQEVAIEAMGRNCQDIWLPELRTELESDDPAFRLQAVLAAAEMEEQELIRDLVPRTQDADEEVKLAAIGALGVIGGEDAEDILTQLEHSLDPDVRQAAVMALREARSQLEFFSPGMLPADDDDDDDEDDER